MTRLAFAPVIPVSLLTALADQPGLERSAIGSLQILKMGDDHRKQLLIELGQILQHAIVDIDPSTPPLQR